MSTTTWLHRWVHQPQLLWLRRAVFQIHLWTGLTLGAYVVVICVSGSALVFRNELSYYADPGPTIVAVSGPRLTDDQLKASALRTFPGAEVTKVWPTEHPDHAIELWLERRGKRLAELFDPYTGRHIGRAEPIVISTLVWLAALHDELLHGESGRSVNGMLGLLLVLISLTGAFVWWPGVGGWRRSLTIDLKANWKRLTWTLHSALGFWCFVVVFGFAFTGFYLVFQEPFMAVVDYLEPVTRVAGGRRRRRYGDAVLRGLAYLHFGRYGGWQMEAAWVVLGLIPPVLFLTGAIMWWNRVLAPAARRLRGTAGSTDQPLTASHTSS